MSGKTGPKHINDDLEEYLNNRLPEGLSLTIRIMAGSRLSLEPSDGMDAEQAMLMLQGGMGAILNFMDGTDSVDVSSYH